MNFFCNPSELSEALSVVSKALPLKGVVPILEGIKIKAEGSKVTFTATDQEIFIERKINAEIKLEGETIVIGKLFADFAKKLTTLPQIQIEKSDKLVIRYGINETEMQCLNEEGYPEIEDCEDDSRSFFIKEGDFKDALEKTLFCVALDDSRPILKGCLLEVKEGVLTAVALDGYRLALYKTKVRDEKGDIKMVISGKMLKEISNITEFNETEIKVILQEKTVFFDLGHTKISTRLMEGDFLQYQKIMPVNFNSLVDINKNKLEEGLDRASLIIRNKKNNYLKLSVREKDILIQSNSELGSIKENIDCRLEGRELEIAFNSKYLHEALSKVKEDYIKIEFTSSNAPAVLRPIEGEKFKYIILPVRLLG